MSVCIGRYVASAAGASFTAPARRLSVKTRGGMQQPQPRWRVSGNRKSAMVQKVHRILCRAESRSGSGTRPSSSRTGSVGDGSIGESATESAARLNREALEAKTRITLAETRARRERQIQIEEKAQEFELEMQRREEGARVAEEVGGRRPTQRKCFPIVIAGVQCTVLAVGFFFLTQKAAEVLTNPESQSAMANKTLIINLAVGAGVGTTCLLTISSIILFLVAWREGIGVIRNTPITYYRCDGSGRECCKCGPHNLGYNKKFTYLANGKGFETRQKDSMRRHLLVSRQCRPLKPVLLYPEKEGWKLW